MWAPDSSSACDGAEKQSNNVLDKYPDLLTSDATKLAFLENLITDKFGLTFAEDGQKWNLRSVQNAYNAYTMIDATLNGHLKTMVDGRKLTMKSQSQCTDQNGQKFDCYHGWTPDGTGINFYSSNSSSIVIPVVNFLHETAHLLDNQPATLNVFSDPLRPATTHPTWVDDNGYVDIRLLLGKIKGQPIQAIPMGEHDDANEYWADAFANYVAGNINVAEVTGAGLDMYNYVHDALEPYANP